MNLTFLLSALRARYRIFFMILAVTVLATLLVTLLVPKTYVATVSLLIDGKDEQSMRSGLSPPERERAGYLQTQVDLISSPKVARRVVRDLKLADDATVRERFEATGGKGSIEDWVADGLLKQLKVDTSQSSIIQLAAASDDPQFSARVANSFAKAYVDTVLELRVEPTRQTSTWFNEQLKNLRDNLEQAERRLADFRQEHGIVAADERYDVENIQLADLAGLAVRTRDAGGGSASSSANPESRAEVLASPNIQALRTDLLRAEAKLQEMSAELGVKHPQYLRQLAEVQSLRTRVDGEIKHVVSGAQQAVQRSRAQRASLLAELDARRERVLKLTQARNQMSVLAHDVAIAERTYETAMQRFVASTIDSRARQTNVSILDAATPPALPAKPRIFVNLGIALLVGILLGFATVHLLEISDQRVRLIDDLAADPRVPLLAVLAPWNAAGTHLLDMPSARRALPGPG